MSVKRTSDAFISGRDKLRTLPPERSIASYLASQPEVVFPDVKPTGGGRNTNSVFIFSSNRSVQEALAAVLTHTLRCSKILVVTNLAEVQAGLASALPDLVIIDGNTRHSLAAAILLKHSGLDSRVVVFGMEDPVRTRTGLFSGKAWHMPRYRLFPEWVDGRFGRPNRLGARGRRILGQFAMFCSMPVTKCEPGDLGTDCARGRSGLPDYVWRK